jgi:hypothetical protein
METPLASASYYANNSTGLSSRIQRFRENYERLENHAHIGTSILSNNYSRSLGFGRNHLNLRQFISSAKQLRPATYSASKLNPRPRSTIILRSKNYSRPSTYVSDKSEYKSEMKIYDDAVFHTENNENITNKFEDLEPPRIIEPNVDQSSSHSKETTISPNVSIKTPKTRQTKIPINSVLVIF